MKLLFDFFPIVIFFITYKFYDFFVATAVLIIATSLQVGWSWFKNGRVERMPLIALGLLLVFGGITLISQDEVFLKWKVSIVNWLFAAVFLGSQYIGKKTIIERMMGANMELPPLIWVRLNLAWAVFFMSMGVINLIVAFNFATDTWVNFKLFGLLGLTLVFVIAQGFYLVRYLETDIKEE